MRRTPLESVTEGRLKKAVDAAGGLCIKLPAALYRGIPDRMILLPGSTIIFAEIKKDATGRTALRTRFHQNKFSDTLSRLGFSCVKIRGPEELDEFIRTYLRGDPHA